MPGTYAVYKGLQKPLVFKGFQGKYIYWGLASLLCGLVSGALLMSLVSMWLGAFALVACITGGLLFTSQRQKGGLHSKRRDTQILILNRYGRKKII
ncbi:plasmid transfer protein [Mucilaginibacter terrae]|uniref:DUF4133 domain-containing protein n=1 Tax=Mucilaginibacter terrae TaxID=1955052 RepID=A0ABU3GNV0_9SPHI|nr:plasmid transfer protein [Mucilaginibacter terrae]MDT3401275.1 hypothetical protein [Mucilaginibacter terrae]